MATIQKNLLAISRILKLAADLSEADKKYIVEALTTQAQEPKA